MTKSIQHTMSKNGLILAVFAIVTTGLIALTYFGTKDQIALQQQQKLLSILNAVIDNSSYDNAIQFDCALVTSAELLGSDESQHVYRATKQGKGVAVAIETTTPDGYSGKIHLVVGVTSSETGSAKVTGVRILEHKETPGLGDKIDLRISDWVLDFDNQTYSADIATNWAVKKDGGQFDQFTGATITPRAVVSAVKLSAEYYLANQAAIFNAANACAVNNSADAIVENAVAKNAVAKKVSQSNE
ncbi:electron transport complex subunit RsxG [uncultured Paraglaciecola sp.]|jgi:Na+-translocating ferredoxin:NAD+ oxidoreductase subunit G|uniref:electron transport complex subunit RsxG n=1 Tax=uncultured Paraglaciecola sp. TaxID=1765024 RepID=UPI0025F62BBE|nr:electron transport complex subunit RsxG [uncultured Paraglaciecola sp.]